MKTKTPQIVTGLIKVTFW